MNKFTIRCSMLGLFATALSVGCGGGDAPNDKNTGATGATTAAITAVGSPIVNGCSVSQVFDITSAANQNIGFVAFQSQNLNDSDLQIFSVDANGNQSAMAQSSHAISAAMQQMLNLNQSTSNSLANNSSASTQNASNAATSTQAANNASNSSNAQNSSNLSEDDSTTSSHLVHQDANASNSNSNSNSALTSQLLSLLGFSPSLIAKANQNFAANNDNNAASESNLSIQDSVQHQKQLQTSNQASADNQSSNDASTAAASNLANSTAQQAANSTDAQAAQSIDQNNSASSSASDDASAASNQAFTNMEQQQLQHVRVLVNATANNQQANTTVSTGANQSVFANVSFPLVLSACGGTITPIITP
jgi:hypothetical protein